MKLSEDPFVVLGVARDASDETVQTAYRRLAQRHHPDRHGGSPAAHAQFLRVRSAYDVLRDPLQRQQWLHRHAQAAPPAPAPSPPWSSTWNRWAAGVDQGARPRRGPMGDHASVVMKVRLEDAFASHQQNLRARVARTCVACSGGDPECKKCGGTGQRFETLAWRVTVPAGLPDGTVLRLVGMGHDGPRFGGPGDVEARIVWTHRGPWRWDGERLVAVRRLPRGIARKGGPWRWRWPDGQQGHLVVPAGTLPGAAFRLKGLGLPGIDGVRADVWVVTH